MKSPWTWHGGDLDAARAWFGEGGDPWIDLSTGINPHGWPGAAGMAIDWRGLPSKTDLREMEEIAAVYFDVDPRHVCALPGTETGLRLASDLLGPRARYLAPCYRTHEDMFPLSSAITAAAMESPDGGTIILANPNNPDGHCWPRDALLDLADRRADEEWLIVDEAFADSDPATSLARDIADDRRLLIFRSFGKFFGLAGLRLGFLLGPEAIVGRMRRKLGAWPVSAAAIAIGRAAYADRDWIAAMRERLPRERRRLDDVLTGCGYSPVGACPLFRLIVADDAMALFERLAKQTILTRPFDYEPRWLRIGLPETEEALDRLQRALLG
ncbi:aminotransferase class I/II-fold pyridoxal phosphate-dependent enzyme [Sphingobium cloacae]|uniref:Aminotransferase n=1 Tax=Sphingobium cloacae TaxID=120107 RepID=A0A1E1F0A9_9SPHN|nr:aminotransferase class I/II-fold pyridoxal phosphate-dependent enzyme [Sphingobium cloacae]BAV63949.1 aminotransferase [Sphingobium cloacae]